MSFVMPVLLMISRALRRAWPVASSLGTILLASATAAAANTCSYATTGINKNSLCWFDFTGYNDGTASGSGQAFNFALPDGSTLSMTVKRSGSSTVTATTTPTYSAATIGNGQYNAIGGKPALYGQTNKSPFTITLSGVTLKDKNGNARAFEIFGADAESTDGGESLTFGTTGAAWKQVEIVTGGATICNGVTGVGTNSAVWQNTSACGTEGSIILSAPGSPSQVSIAAVQGGLQAVSFGIVLPQVTFSKTISSRVNAADEFTVSQAYTSNPTTIGSATSVGAATTATTGVISTIPSNALTLSEVMAAGSASKLGQYASSISCVNANSTTTVLPSGVGTSFSLTTQVGDSITCTLTNSPAPATVAVQKITLGGVGGPFSISQTNLASTPPSMTTTAAGVAAPASPTPINVKTIGTAVTLTETSVPGFVLTAANCTDLNAAATGNTGSLGTLTGSTLTIPASNVVAGSNFNCTFTNTKLPTVTVTKISNSGVGAFN